MNWHIPALLFTVYIEQKNMTKLIGLEVTIIFKMEKKKINDT